MSIKIETQKIVMSDGTMGRKILNVTGVIGESQLIKLYRKNPNGYFRAYENGGIDFHIPQGNKVQDIMPDSIISETSFQASIERAKEFGNQLKEAKEKLKEIGKTWNGNETFVI